ncbi:MAG: VWA domain-containing protein, partial [Candidatus Krumholzibacteria bacterium]|nr:VWA domain-containing protein [Candidatus Krumholzibacteria bacterium]
MSAERIDLIVEPDPLKIAAAAVLVVIAIVLYRRTIPPLRARRRAPLILLRAAAFLLLVLFLLDPALVSTSEHRREPVVPVLLDRSGSMALSGRTDGARFDDAVSAARSIAGLLDGARVDIIPFAAVAGEPLGPFDSLPRADGEGTDISGAIESAAGRYRGENLAAIVLLTDGRVTRGIAGAVQPVPVPVFAVGFGDTLEGAGLSVEDVDYPRVTWTGVRERITAVIRYSLPPGSRATIRLVDEGTVVDEYLSGELGGEGRFEAPLGWAPAAEGIRRLEVRAATLPGEAVTADNVEQLRISVLKDRLEILHIDRHPDWEMTFLRELAAGSPRADLETALWAPGRGYRLTSGAPWTAPADAAALAVYDLLIVGDGEPDGEIPIAAIREYVSRGGGLLFLASERSPLFDPAARTALEGVLPLRSAGSPRLEAGEFSAIPAPDGGELVARLSAPETPFERLPPLPAAAVGFEPTAGALVPFVLERGGAVTPLVALQRSGEGICGVIAAAGLFRWRLAGPEGAEAYRILLSGLVEYLAGGHREPGLSLLADRTVYRAGERIRVDAIAADRRADAAVRGE